MEIISFVKIKRNSGNFYILQSETFRRASLDACKSFTVLFVHLVSLTRCYIGLIRAL